MATRLLLTVFAFALTGLALVGQPARQAENWHFANGQLISFATGAPVLTGPSAMVAFEGCVSMSDTNGNIQFYTNGGGQGTDQAQDGVIWNKNNDRLFDWATRGGGGISARQTSIAFADPSGAEGLYYLFTMEDRENATSLRPPGNGLSYYVIDMTQDANLGKVTQQRERYVPNVVEALDAAAMADGSGYWVIANRNDGGNSTIITIPVTADGVGAPVEAGFPLLTDHYTFSPDGAYLYAKNSLFAYDNATGTVGELIRDFPNSESVSAGFTANSQFIYLIENINFESVRLVRYDLNDFTRLEVALLSNTATVGSNFKAFQLGPDGNLYFPEAFTTGASLNQISCASSQTPVFVRGLLSLPVSSANRPVSNLPQYVDDIFIGTEVNDTVTLERVTVLKCPADSLVLEPRVTGDAYGWNDGSSGSTLTVLEPGEYCVTVTQGCGQTIDCQIVETTSAPNAATDFVLTVTPLDGTETCDGREAIARIVNVTGDTSAVTIVWFDGSTLDSLALTLEEGVEVSAMVTDSCGVTADLSFAETIEACMCDDPVFPEIISANNDGVNDTFRPFGNCELVDYSLVIFNRWGQEVFAASTWTEGWDGNLDGSPQNMGTYLFLSSFRIEGMEEVRRVEGQFSLVR